MSEAIALFFMILIVLVVVILGAALIFQIIYGPRNEDQNTKTLNEYYRRFDKIKVTLDEIVGEEQSKEIMEQFALQGILAWLFPKPEKEKSNDRSA